MQKLVLLILTIYFFIPEVHALKMYSYDSNGNRVYQKVYGKNYTVVQAPANQVVSKSSGRTYVPNTNGRKIRTYSRTDNGRTYVYNSNGKRIRTYSSPGNGRTYVYDSNGKRIKTYSSPGNGRTYVYNAKGQKIRTYSTTDNGRTYVYAHPVQSGSHTFVRSAKTNTYQNQFNHNQRRVINRRSGGSGTRIVSTTSSWYR